MTDPCPCLRLIARAIPGAASPRPSMPVLEDAEIVLGALRDSPTFVRFIRENGPPESGGIRKYLDFETYIPDCCRYAHLTWADLLPPMRILDLGTGFGYFPYVCRCFGHEVTGLDLDDEPLYNEATRILGIPRRVHRIERFSPLPPFPRKFDLITAFATCFNRHNCPDLWGVEEWTYFLHDLVENQLTARGRIFLAINPARTGGFGKEGLAEFFSSLGGRMTGQEIAFDDVSRIREVCRP